MPSQVPFYSSQATLGLNLVPLISNLNGASSPDNPSPFSFSTIIPVKQHLTAQLSISSSATMSTEELVSLDWRDAPSCSEIVGRLIKLFSDLDENGTVSLCLSQSNAKGAICLIQQDGEAIIRRRNNLVS